jgi:hypothetical protein
MQEVEALQAIFQRELTLDDEAYAQNGARRPFLFCHGASSLCMCMTGFHFLACSSVLRTYLEPSYVSELLASRVKESVRKYTDRLKREKREREATEAAKRQRTGGSSDDDTQSMSS